MSSLASPIGPTIDVVARTVSRSVISGGNNVDIQPQESLIERNLEVQTSQNNQQTQEISALKSTVYALRTETSNLNNKLRKVEYENERNLEVQTSQNNQQTQEISALKSTVDSLNRSGALAVQPQASLVNVERNLEVQTSQNNQQTQEISALRSETDTLKTEVNNVRRSSALAVQPQASLVNVERNLEVQTNQNTQQTQEISALRSETDTLKTEVNNVRRSSALAVQPQASLVNVERNLEVQTNQNNQQTQEISTLKSAVDALRTETTTLNQGLVSITNLIQQDSAVEKQQAAEEAESERKLAEKNVRLGKESQLEQRITNALAKPVQALQQKVGNIFGRIGEALTALFAGWLTNQGIEALKAASEGNKNKLEEIKDNVLNGIGDAIKVFTAIKTGFNLVIKTITGVTAKIAGFVTRLALAPIKALTNTLRGVPALKNVFPGPKKPGGGGGKGPGIFGPAWAAVESFMNFKNGEYVDAIMPIVSIFGPGKFIRGLFAVGYAADNIAEVFGTNIFGKDPNKEKEAKIIFEEEKNKRKEQNPKEKSTTQTTAAKVTSASTAQTPMMGDKKDDKSETDPKNMTPGPVPGSANIQSTPDSDASSAASNAAPVAASTPGTSMAPQASELSLNNHPGALVPGQRPDKALNSEQFKAATQAREEAKVQGLSGKELEIYVANAAMNAKSSDVNISSPAQVQPLPKPTQNVGELSEPAPNVIMMPSGQSNNQQSSISQAPTNGTDTPLISSSNPDNFYVLYSQLNYNVVI